MTLLQALNNCRNAWWAQQEKPLTRDDSNKSIARQVERRRNASSKQQD